jgi:cytochrome c oxidase subunit 2
MTDSRAWPAVTIRAALRARLLVAALAAFLLLALPALALGDGLTPESGGSANADSIATLYKIVLGIAVVILLIVEVSLVWCLVRFKARKGRVAAQIHGNTNLEIGWTVGAALILVVLSVVTFAMLGKITQPPNSDAGGFNAGQPVLAASTSVPKPPNGKALHVCVTGRQYIWRYTYSTCGAAGLGKVYAYQELVVPAKTTVVLDIQATDVVHSWWIPQLGGKFDAIPGKDNFTWFKAPRAGEVYGGQCAELCGRNHADMTARVRVVSPTEFESWISRQKSQIAAANRDAQKQRKILDAGHDL